MMQMGDGILGQNLGYNRKLIIIDGEEDIFISHIESEWYIGADEGCIATPFQALEISPMVTLPVEKGNKYKVTSWKDLQATMECDSSKGWGKLPKVPEKKNRFGLGYESSKATLKGKAHFPPIQETFVNKGIEHGRHVTMISNKVHTRKETNFIRECAPGEEIKSWIVVEIPEIFFFPK